MDAAARPSPGSGLNLKLRPRLSTLSGVKAWRTSVGQFLSRTWGEEAYIRAQSPRPQRPITKSVS